MLCTLYALIQKPWNVSLFLRCQRTVTSSTVNGMSKRPLSNYSRSNKRQKTGMEPNTVSSQKPQYPPSSTIKEINGDLFTCPETHALAHCISADVRMGKGIAVKFKDLFGDVDKLKYQRQGPGGLAVLQHGERYIYNLVTKRNYWDKPTYETLGASLEKMRDHNLENKVTNLCMPKIGCGLDRLKWYEVKKMITQIYQGTNIKITVYHYEEDKKDKPTKPNTAEYDGESGQVHQNYPPSQNRRGYKDNDYGRGQSRGSGGNSSSNYNRDGSYNEYGSRQSRGSGGRPPSQHNRGSYHDHGQRQSRDSNNPGSLSKSRHPNPNQRQAKISEFSSSGTDSHKGVKTSEKDLSGLTKELHGNKDSGKKDDDAKQYRGEGTTRQTNQKKQASGIEGKPVKIDRKTSRSVAESHESRGGAQESGRNDEDRDEGRHSEREDRSENTVKDCEKKKETKKSDDDERKNDSQNERTKKNNGGERSNQDGSGNKNTEEKWNNGDGHPGEKEERSQEQTNDHKNQEQKEDEEDDTLSQDKMKVKEEDLSQNEHKKSQVKDEENSQEFKEDSEARDIQSKNQRECSNKEDVNSGSDDESTSVETVQEPGGAGKDDDKGEAMSDDSSKKKKKRKKRKRKKKRNSVEEEK